MIPHGVEIFVGLEPIDLRWSFDRLTGIVQERIGRDVRSGALFVFFGKRRFAVKVVFFDQTGLCIFYKRLDKGNFLLPEGLDVHSSVVEISERVLEELLDGIALEARHAGRRAHVRLH